MLVFIGNGWSVKTCKFVMNFESDIIRIDRCMENKSETTINFYPLFKRMNMLLTIESR